VQQLESSECGAACLAMVLAFHGKEVSLEAVRDLCGGGRDGVSARVIVDAAAHLGLRGRGVKLDVDQLALLPAGAILHWEFQHFVVLAQVRADGVEIVDPAVGRRIVSKEAFGRSFTGVALLFEPNDLFRKGRRSDLLWPAVARLVRESGLVSRVVVMSLVLQLLALALPLLTGQVVDRVLPRGDGDLLVMLLVGLGLLVGFRALAQLVRGHLLLHLKTSLDARMSQGFLDHMVSLPFAFFQRRSAGDLMMRLNGNLSRPRAADPDHPVGDAGRGDGGGQSADPGGWQRAHGRGRGGGRRAGGGRLPRHPPAPARAGRPRAGGGGPGPRLRGGGADRHRDPQGQRLRAAGGRALVAPVVDQLNVKLERERLGLGTAAFTDAVRAAAPLLVLAVGTAQVLQGHLTLGAMLAWPPSQPISSTRWPTWCRR
jgi:ABC-type bacteriocin/lantibiotic exporter with double-glycine peptidase domain